MGCRLAGKLLPPDQILGSLLGGKRMVAAVTDQGSFRNVWRVSHVCELHDLGSRLLGARCFPSEVEQSCSRTPAGKASENAFLFPSPRRKKRRQLGNLHRELSAMQGGNERWLYLMRLPRTRNRSASSVLHNAARKGSPRSGKRKSPKSSFFLFQRGYS